MRDDLDHEGRVNGRKGKERLLNSIIQNAMAPLVLADTMKNSALTSDVKIKDAWKKSMKDYPESVFENSVEGVDVISSHFPKFASENSGTAAGLGLLVDIADPMSYGLTKIGKAAGVPLTLAQATMKAGDKAADAGTKTWIQKLIKKKDMKSVERLTDYIKKNELRGELRHPEKLIETLDGKYDVNEVKVKDGTMDKVGQDIVGTARKADRQGAQKINRGEIFNKMKRAVENQNADDTVSGIIKKEPYLGKLSEVIKPFKREKYIVEGQAPSKPGMTPTVPESDVESLIDKLSREANDIKKGKASQSVQKKERETAEAMAKKQKEASDKASANEGSDIPAKQAAQKKERQAAESKVAKTNAEIEAENKMRDQELINLLLKRKSAEADVEPLDMIPVPKAQKGLPPIPAKEVLDIQIHNKKAGLQNKKYLEKAELEPTLPSLEEQIELLKSTPKKPLQEVDVPPPMPDDAFEMAPPPIPKMDIDVPPAIPNEAIGRDLESVLAELSDAQASKANLAKTNSKIKGENTDALKNYGLEAKANSPKVKEKLVDRISTLEDMWRLKVDARKKLRQADWDANIKNLPEHKQMVMTATQEIDNKIVESLKDINFAEGNAADIYRMLNDEFGTQSDFLELVVDDTINKWKGGKTKGGALPALSGGVAAAIAAKMGGGNVPLSTVAGGVSGEAARRGMGLSPEMKASIGDRFSRPEAAHLGTQTVVEGAESLGEVTGLTPKKEKHVEEVRSDDLDFSAIPSNKLDFSGTRNPQSVEEIPGAGDATDIMAPQDPIDQKMDDVLMPQKPVWDPYINEEVLNTYLPRDSKRILANPMALMAKIHQVAPNQAPMIQELLDNDPEGMEEAGPKIAMMFPTLFEKDKYGAFDGKIIDPMMQQKFLSDLAQDEDMDSIEKASIAMKLQRGESVYS